MKNLVVAFSLLLISVSYLTSCDSRDKTKIAMDKAFKKYIAKNDSIKNYNTKVVKIETISYNKIAPNAVDSTEEVYQAQVYFVGSTAYEGSIKVYNINDTVTSYFDKDLNMTRWINSNNQ